MEVTKLRKCLLTDESKNLLEIRREWILETIEYSRGRRKEEYMFRIREIDWLLSKVQK